MRASSASAAGCGSGDAVGNVGRDKASAELSALAEQVSEGTAMGGKQCELFGDLVVAHWHVSSRRWAAEHMAC